MIIHLEKEEDFLDYIKKDIVLVDFFATWCGPCKMLTPVLERLAKEHESIPVVKIDVDDFEDLSRQYGIMSVPTLLLFKKGNLEKKQSGFQSITELEEFIQ